MVALASLTSVWLLQKFKLLLNKSDWNCEKRERELGKERLGCQNKQAEESEAEKEHGKDQEARSNTESKGKPLEGMEGLLDEDGDLEVVRRPRLPDGEARDLAREKVCPIILLKGGNVLEEEEGCCCDVIKIEHAMATPLEDVGKQVWRGAVLLADYILCQRDVVKDCTVLELGGGTGIVSIVAAMAAKRVYCTDIGEDLLDMCEQNIALNKDLIETANKGGKVKVRGLDWMKDQFCTDPGVAYSWSEEEIAELQDLLTVILAADVFYDDDLTDAFFRTLYRITHNLKNTCIVYLSIEKRLNFTLRYMDVECEAYCHFRNTLSDLVNIRDGKMKYTAEPVQLSFPQRIVYERVEQLELWKITAEAISERSGGPERLK